LARRASRCFAQRRRRGRLGYAWTGGWWSCACSSWKHSRLFNHEVVCSSMNRRQSYDRIKVFAVAASGIRDHILEGVAETGRRRAVADAASQNARPNMEAAARTDHATIVSQNSKAGLAARHDAVPVFAPASPGPAPGQLAKASRRSDADPEPEAVARAACWLRSQSLQVSNKKGGRSGRPKFCVTGKAISLA
jgi:hypothetical protein